MGECNFFENEDGISMCRPDTINLSPEGSEVGIVTWIGISREHSACEVIRELVAEVFSKQVKQYQFEVDDVVGFDFNKDEHITDTILEIGGGKTIQRLLQYRPSEGYKVPFLRGVARLIKLLNHKLLLANIFVLVIPWERM